MNYPMTDFRLHSFLAVCRAGSYSRAAGQLNITQPAVSQHIRYLEEELECRLFTLRDRTLTLTREGELLRRFAETAESDARRTRELIAGRIGSRTFRFGATRTIGEYVLPGCIAPWLRDHPETELSMLVDNSENLFEALRRGELDFAFIEGIFSRDEYDADVLLADAFIPVCAPGDPVAGRTVGFADILARPLLVRERGSGSRLILEQALASCNRTVGSFGRIVEIGNIGAIKSLVAEGAGITFLYEWSVRRELAAGTLARVRLAGFDVRHDFAFVCLPGSIFAGDYREFLRYCRERTVALAPPPGA